MNPERREALTWEIFKEEVYNKYVPMSYRRAKVVEFHTLKQGNMTVTEYDRALCEITRYAPELVDTDEKMAEKFRADVEEALPKETTVANTTPVPLQQHNFRDKRKWDGDRTPYDNKRQQPIRNPPQYGGRKSAPYQRGDFRPRAPQCAKCFKNHFGECREKSNKCYTCGGNGHFSRECPSKIMGMGAGQNNQGFRPQVRALQAEPRGYLPAPQQQQQQRRQGLPTQARAYALKGKQPTNQQGNQEQGNLAGWESDCVCIKAVAAA
ncbi:uncharacterized protein LOC121810382 [Salvia splendens]|uniref:uncharacterized protein LOC121810382 n=1 Tax=Salvia splendens TaxID=180675 RepID=UPI001C256A94|nr:uncharacterized protein LOC121810382 [Salvia splendens]